MQRPVARSYIKPSTPSTSATRTMTPSPEPLPTWRVLTIAVSANLGGFLNGLHLALFSGILEMPSFAQSVTPDGLSTLSKSLITTVLIFALTVSSPLVGPLVDRIGRRPSLVFTAFLFLLSSQLSLLSATVPHLIASRFIAGIAYALANIACPMYTAEIAPSSLRGALVNLYQLAITVGIVVAQLANLAYVDGSWRGPVWVSLVCATAMLAIVWLVVPESPLWLQTRAVAGGGDNAARTNGSATSTSSDVDTLAAEEGCAESSSLPPSSQRSPSPSPPQPVPLGPDAVVPTQPVTLGALLRDASARRRLLIGAGLSAAQQWSGINAVIFFAPALIADAFRWHDARAPLRAAVALGATNVAATLVAVALVDRAGRRALLLAGVPPMVAALVALGALREGLVAGAGPAVGMVALFVFVGAFATTYGPLPFVVCSEIFPVRYKGLAMSVCSLVLGLCSLVVGVTFLPLLEGIGGKVYWIYAGCMLLAGGFVWQYVPRYGSKMSLSDIDALLEGKATS